MLVPSPEPHACLFLHVSNVLTLESDIISSHFGYQGYLLRGHHLSTLAFLEAFFYIRAIMLLNVSHNAIKFRLLADLYTFRLL